jgi:hypothetical protein
MGLKTFTEKYWRGAALFLFPVWGTIAFVAIVSVLPRGGSVGGSLVPILGFSAPMVGLVPILKAQSLPTLLKVLLSCVYYVAALFVIFIVGWLSICQFFPSCH